VVLQFGPWMSPKACVLKAWSTGWRCWEVEALADVGHWGPAFPRELWDPPPSVSFLASWLWDKEVLPAIAILLAHQGLKQWIHSILDWNLQNCEPK
jgi:hypothetical protein